jgi:hypothetical protein
MKKIKMIAGIFWAFLCLILILILFPGLNSLSGSAARLPFMKINPNYSGGEVAKQIVSGAYSIDIREPVFDGLIRERSYGFVQIDWRGNIPDEIIDSVDYDLDNVADFRILIRKKENKSEISPFNDKVGTLLISTPTSYGWAIRVKVRKGRSVTELIHY